jgi:hypothetical protein
MSNITLPAIVPKNPMRVGKDLDISITRSIGYYYFEKNKGGTLEDQISVTRKEIESLLITSVHYDGYHIIITISRPGLLIGHHGKNIQALETKLREEYTFNMLVVNEDEVHDNLYTFEFAMGYD